MNSHRHEAGRICTTGLGSRWTNQKSNREEQHDYNTAQSSQSYLPFDSLRLPSTSFYSRSILILPSSSSLRQVICDQRTLCLRFRLPSFASSRLSTLDSTSTLNSQISTLNAIVPKVSIIINPNSRSSTPNFNIQLSTINSQLSTPSSPLSTFSSNHAHDPPIPINIFSFHIVPHSNPLRLIPFLHLHDPYESHESFQVLTSRPRNVFLTITTTTTRPLLTYLVPYTPFHNNPVCIYVCKRKLSNPHEANGMKLQFQHDASLLFYVLHQKTAKRPSFWICRLSRLLLLFTIHHPSQKTSSHRMASPRLTSWIENERDGYSARPMGPYIALFLHCALRAI